MNTTSPYFTTRTGRLLTQLNEDRASISDLITNTSKVGTTDRESDSNRITPQNIKFIPYKGSKCLLVTSNVSGNSTTYKTTINLMNVDFTGTGASIQYADQNYMFAPIDPNTQPMQVTCSCLDFRFRFANYDKTSGNLFGKSPPLYVRRTTDHPSPNPTKLPGACKHILALYKSLIQLNIVG